jgi:hypothetical protein
MKRKYDPGLHAQISGTYAQIQASTIQVVLMLLLAIDDWRFGGRCRASMPPRRAVVVTTGSGGRFEEVLQEPKSANSRIEA